MIERMMGARPPSARPFAQIAALRSIARDHGLTPVDRLGSMLAETLGNGGGPAALRPWLDVLGDAIGSEVTGDAAADAYVASVMVRLGALIAPTWTPFSRYMLTALALEIGDRTQLLASLLSARYAKPLPVIIGIFAASLLLSGIAAFGGALAAGMINNRAATLLLGLALISGGSGGFFRVKPAEPVERWRLGALASSFGAFFILAALDKTMFAVFAFTAVSPQWPVLALAAAIGTTLANVPAVLLGLRFVLPRWLRPAIGGGLILAGIYLAIGALGLI